jgi:hypothetical protein
MNIQCVNCEGVSFITNDKYNYAYIITGVTYAN